MRRDIHSLFDDGLIA
ncbi:hypothetical protein KCP70_14830 [Salmonella enterica subsp. enterica]|nr:hypothetical protein KCP70_14830 [Salmonella enterica subsp. enterica]